MPVTRVFRVTPVCWRREPELGLDGADACGLIDGQLEAGAGAAAGCMLRALVLSEGRDLHGM